MDQRIFMNPVRPLHLPNKSIQTDPNHNTAQTPSGTSFSQLFKQELKHGGTQPIQFSKHAEKRLASRNINLDEKRIERLSKAMDQVAAKGAKESLLLMDNIAFVVSVKNRMVITAVDGQSMEENVFTNIDSAVIVK